MEDPNLPDYQPVSGVSGSLISIGSDTLNNQMTLWAEGFRSFYPNVSIEIQGAGSGTAPPALVQGTAQFGPMSRAMRGTEIEEFEARYGYEPTAIRGAIDALAVYVHKDNPIECMTMQQVDAVFSSTRNGGADAPINTWGELGMTGEWANRPIALYGRNSASGTYGYFKQVALFDGDFRSEVREQPGSSTVVQGVASDIGAIGYSGVGYMTADVRAVPLDSTVTAAMRLPARMRPRVSIRWRGSCTSMSTRTRTSRWNPCAANSSATSIASRGRRTCCAPASSPSSRRSPMPTWRCSTLPTEPD
jgi:phosphate transport system substrate-binding protein